MAKKKKPDETPVASQPPDTVAAPRPRLHKLTVKNFRCIGPAPVEIELDDIVVLVGPNNAGKSSILRAYEVVMQHGSKDGELTIDDFPGACVADGQHPEIELDTIVFDAKQPGEQWVATDPITKEMHVRERWTWTTPGQPKKVGWDVAANNWHDSQGPWGAPNVAQAARPEPHRVRAFDSPEEQARNIVKLLKEALTARVKQLMAPPSGSTSAGTPSQYEQLLESVKALRQVVAKDATTAVDNVAGELSKMIAEVFPGHSVSFDARPEEDIENCISLYKTDPLLRMGPMTGHMAPIDKQGSGARRTLLWTALRILAEQNRTKKQAATERPHLLLMDEPELCLHPDAIREARRVLYDLPKTGNWQVMVTTHSPVFIDLSRNNTSIVRVARSTDGKVTGTTIFRPEKAQLDDDDRTLLKMLNACDPYVAEFFFGGYTVLVEGDTEYTAFNQVIADQPEKGKNVHIVRARGKATIVTLCKILNRFQAKYAVLHDSDRPTVPSKKTGKDRANPAWTVNTNIRAVVEPAVTSSKVRLVASVPNFEEAFFGKEADGEKPYNALFTVKHDAAAFKAVEQLLDGLIDHSKPLPTGAVQWGQIADLEKALPQDVGGATTAVAPVTPKAVQPTIAGSDGAVN